MRTSFWKIQTFSKGNNRVLRKELSSFNMKGAIQDFRPKLQYLLQGIRLPGTPITLRK
jgi:hypothetical protein